MSKKKKIILREIEGLTPRQQAWLRFYLKCGNASTAAERAYNCKNREVAGSIGSENLHKLSNVLLLLMDRRGLDDGKMLTKLDEGLDAKRVISAVKGSEATGATTDFIEVPDLKTQHKFLETLIKLRGYAGKKEAGVSISHSNVGFFSVPKEKREEFNRKFSKFVRKQAMVGEEVVPEKEEGYKK